MLEQHFHVFRYVSRMQNDRNCEGAHIVPLFLTGASLPLILFIFMIPIAFVRQGTNPVSVLLLGRSDFFIDRIFWELCKILINIRLLWLCGHV